MTEPITVEEALRAIEREIEVCDMATPGEWFTNTNGFNIYSGSKEEQRLDKTIAVTGHNACHRSPQTIADGAFIVHARNGYRAVLEYMREEAIHQRDDFRFEYCDEPLRRAVAPIVKRWKEEGKL